MDAGKRLTKFIEYLKEPTNYWSFEVNDTGSGFLGATSSRDWKPEFYRGPETRPVDSKRSNRDSPYLVPKKP